MDWIALPSDTLLLHCYKGHGMLFKKHITLFIILNITMLTSCANNSQLNGSGSTY